MKLELVHVARIFVVLFVASMSLEARLLEQNVSSEFAFWKVEERTCEKQAQVNACTVLNLHCADAQSVSFLEWIDAITFANADMVCIQGITTEGNARNIGEALQDIYTYFLYLDPAIKEGQRTSNIGKLLIANKYSFTTDSNSITTDAVGFITNTYFYQEDANTLVLEFLTKEAASDYAISTYPVRILGQAEGIVAHIVENTLECLDTFFTHQGYPQVMQTGYCNTDRNMILARRGGSDNDNKGGTYALGKITVDFTPDGAELSASACGGYEDKRGNYVEVEVSREKEGNTSASLEVGHDNRDKNQ